jgi:abnormal spindle-like microcephaly-associated protein
MNPTEFASISNPLRKPPRRPRPSLHPHATLHVSDTAPQGIVSHAESLIRERQNQNRKSRAPFSELRANGHNSFDRQDSPDPQISLAMRTMRDPDLNDTTTNLTNPATLNHESTRTMNLNAYRPSRETFARPAARRPVSAILAERLAATSTRKDYNDGAGDKTQALMRREARRRTIYVPDDTTVLTIHPGASLASKSDGRSSLAAQRAVRRGSVLQKEQARRRKSIMPSAVHEGGISTEKDELPSLPPLPPLPAFPAPQQTVPEIVVEPNKKSRRSSLAVAPRRMKIVRDIALPTLTEDSESKPVSVSQNIKSSRPPLASNNSLQNVKFSRNLESSNAKSEGSQKRPIRQSLATGHKRLLSAENIHAPLMKKVNEIIHMSTNQPMANSRTMTSKGHNRSQSNHELQTSKTNSVKSSVQSSVSQSKQTSMTFSVLKEDFAHPELYEESWLEHKEIALTHLLNAFFQATKSNTKAEESQSVLRSTILTLYNSQDMSNLMKRLQASLTYGSLTVPKELLAKSIRLKDDVGQRRQYLNLFLDVYSLPLLQAAAEVVVGRQYQKQMKSSTESITQSENTESVDRRSLEAFLDKFFIQHDDVVDSKTGNGTIASIVRDTTEQVGSPTWAWRRTTIRSLMLILILDMAKSLHHVSGCLFQENSPLKSSEAVVKELGVILLPSYGDLMRPLKYLKYEVSVEQSPLEEYRYEVYNLATDLRDGIMLTKIVEIILREFYSVQDTEVDERGQKRISVPNLNLSQNLKYPCISRTQKLHNIMIALSALVHLPSISEKLLKEVTAFDIVDGHREKTLSLLWSLLGQFSMDSLIDWDLLKREILVAQRELSKSSTCDSTNLIDVSRISANSLDACWTLLFVWAKTYSALQGYSVTNLTTSFADGSAFASIISTYAPYLRGSTTLTSTTSLSSTLKSLGCSESFSALLSPSQSTIPTRSFTITCLTFLAARLLPAARSHRAASVIQRAYRLVLARREVHRRVVLMRLASHCAAVVTARDRVIGAAVVLQRAWRRVLNGKIRLLESDVSKFQAIARGWLIRSRNSNTKRVTVGMRAGW